MHGMNAGCWSSVHAVIPTVWMDSNDMWWSDVFACNISDQSHHSIPGVINSLNYKYSNYTSLLGGPSNASSVLYADIIILTDFFCNNFTFK